MEKQPEYNPKQKGYDPLYCLHCENLISVDGIPSCKASICVYTRQQKQGIKYDSNKPRFSLLPLDEIWDVVDVLEYGAKKYAPDNWKYAIMEDETNNRYYDACLRHLKAWKNGEILDTESGLPHLSHAICCLLFHAWKDKNYNNLDYK